VKKLLLTALVALAVLGGVSLSARATARTTRTPIFSLARRIFQYWFDIKSAAE
jgi:hypothetical protein